MPQINKPTNYFNTKLYSGNSSTQSITGVGFQPDFVWIKNRSGGDDHQVTDSVRGATKAFRANATDAEDTWTDGLTSYDSDGFSLGSNSRYNGSGSNYVSWNWLGGGTASSNTDGSITSSVSASTTSGFSIVSYTGTGSSATVGHGLGATPQVVIVKERPNAENCMVYHSSVITASATNKSYLYLNTSDSIQTNGGDTSFTDASNSVFGVGTDGRLNQSSTTYIAYCFAEKKGFSKFGKYTGNGSTDGTFIYTGFKPAFVLIKSTSATGAWIVRDNKRKTFNVNDSYLLPSSSDAEGTNATNNKIDLLSNGFKQRSPSAGTVENSSGTTYAYIAFASEPLVGTNNIPNTAK